MVDPQPVAMASVAFVVKGYPRLSETFIAQEILELERRGLDIRIVSLRHPTDKQHHPIHEEISAAVSYLPEYLHDEPLRVFKAVLAAFRMPGFLAALRIWVRDLRRDRTRNRIRRFGQACVLAHELPANIQQLHAHFLHTPASVARYAAFMKKIPWTGSAHAKDIYTSPDWELTEKLADCDWLVTCTAANQSHLSKLAPTPDTVSLVYHGLDLNRFDPPEHQPPPLDGSSPEQPVIILSVGRIVPKKGYEGLLKALAMLPGELNWRLCHIGGGDNQQLANMATDLGVESRVQWLGARNQEQVLKAYRESHIFVLNSRIAGDGDRDGLPNVLMEAQSQRMACIATAVSAIPELIIDQETGLLVPSDNPGALAEAIKSLISNPSYREDLGLAAEQRVREKFSLHRCIDDLSEQFGLGQ